MKKKYNSGTTYIVNLEMLNTHNARGCESCHRKFCLGETVVVAYGDWPYSETSLIHESDAVFDPKTKSFYDREFYRAMH